MVSFTPSKLVQEIVRIILLFIATIFSKSNEHRNQTSTFHFLKSFNTSHDLPGIWLTLSSPEGSPSPFLSSQAFPLEGLPWPWLFLLALSETQKWIWQGLYIKLKWFADMLVLILLFGLPPQQQALPIANRLMVCAAFLKVPGNF